MFNAEFINACGEKYHMPQSHFRLPNCTTLLCIDRDVVKSSLHTKHLLKNILKLINISSLVKAFIWLVVIVLERKWLKLTTSPWTKLAWTFTPTQYGMTMWHFWSLSMLWDRTLRTKKSRLLERYMSPFFNFSLCIS